MKLLMLFLLTASLNAFEVQRDKVYHFAAGTLIASGTTFAASKMGFKHPRLYGLAAGILAGIGKELYDKRHPKSHSCDPNDAYATFLGASVGITFRF